MDLDIRVRICLWDSTEELISFYFIIFLGSSDQKFTVFKNSRCKIFLYFGKN